MKKQIIISIILQLISIPILYNIIYRIARIFHEPSYRDSSDGMDFYIVTLLFLAILVIISLPILNLIQEYLIKKNTPSILAHLIWFLIIVFLMRNELERRPYSFGLILFCIGTTLVSRLIFKKLIK